MAHGETSLHWVSVATDPATALCCAFPLARTQPVGACCDGRGGTACALEGPTPALRECAGLCLRALAGQPGGVLHLRGCEGDDSAARAPCRVPRRVAGLVQSQHTTLPTSCTVGDHGGHAEASQAPYHFLSA